MWKKFINIDLILLLWVENKPTPVSKPINKKNAYWELAGFDNPKLVFNIAMLLVTSTAVPSFESKTNRKWILCFALCGML